VTPLQGFGGFRGNIHGSSMARWKARGSANLRGNRASTTNDSWRQKTKSPWAISWCCLRDPTFSRCDTVPACDGRTHDDG